jgi:serine/threonine-protein kinase
MNAVPWFERIIPPMPQPSYDEFWTLLAKSGLVDAGAVAALRREHAADPAAGSASTAKDAAAWLGRRGLLTRWQAKRLAIGNLGPFFLGDYRLLERHDREGDALLFTARHEPSGRIVSLVLLNAKRCRRIDVWTEIVQRTTAASEATDPMLSRTWSLEQHESSRIIICEHIEGTSLAAELDQHGPLPAVQAGVLVSQIARAVADLHARGSVHGGLSTDVLLREPSPGGVPRTGRVRLLQFPQVGDPQRIPLRPWNTEAELDQLGRSASFVAPELMLPDAVCDPRADVYSVGAILYALLSGTPPCWEGDARQTLRRAAFGDGPSPLGPPAVTNELATLVGYLMARDPAERYQTAGEAADAIAACLGLAGGAAATVVPTPAFPQADLPTVTAGPTATDGDAMPDFTGLGGPSPPVTIGLPAAAGPAARVAGSAAGPPRAARRGGQQLRLLGGAVTLGILAAVAALVWNKFGSGPERPSDEGAVASTAGSAPGRESPRPSAPTSPTSPKPGGVEGWGVPEPKEGDGQAKPETPGQAATQQPGGGPATVARQIVVADAPDLLWASPTAGPRPRLD